MVKRSLGVAIIGGGLAKDTGGKWRTTYFTESDSFGALGDRLRVIAGSYLYQENPEAELIVLGGKGQLKAVPGVPAVANVIKQELIKLKVPARRIIVETRSGTTFEQLFALSRIIQRGKYDKIMIVSNQYHLSRIRAMIRCDTTLSRVLHRVTLLSAEKIVLRKQPQEWADRISKAYASVAMRRRVQLEKQGIRDFKLGVYAVTKSK